MRLTHVLQSLKQYYVKRGDLYGLQAIEPLIERAGNDVVDLYMVVEDDVVPTKSPTLPPNT